MCLRGTNTSSTVCGYYATEIFLAHFTEPHNHAYETIIDPLLIVGIVGVVGVVIVAGVLLKLKKS